MKFELMNQFSMRTRGGNGLINKGKLHLDISESVWDRMFKSDEDKKKAETILQTLTGMSIISAKELLDKCKECLETLIIAPD